MPYVYREVEELDGHDLVGNAQCVALVQAFTDAPQTARWKQGVSVRGKLLLAKGTAIATFKDGIYPNRSHGNHAALYIRQDQGGLWVMDQWKGDDRKPNVSEHYLQFLGVGRDGNWINPSNNGDAYSVIE